MLHVERAQHDALEPEVGELEQLDEPEGERTAGEDFARGIARRGLVGRREAEGTFHEASLRLPQRRGAAFRHPPLRKSSSPSRELYIGYGRSKKLQ
jgi:hypothetical protein